MIARADGRCRAITAHRTTAGGPIPVRQQESTQWSFAWHTFLETVRTSKNLDLSFQASEKIYTKCLPNVRTSRLVTMEEIETTRRK